MSGCFIPRRIYTFFLWSLLPYIFFHLVWRARKQPEYLEHIAERFGFYKIRNDKPLIWLHTVSVGETRAAVSLIKSLQINYPGHQLLLTHTTPTGREAGEQLYGNDVLRVYLPYDYPFAVQRFLLHFRPQVGVLLETEIWFNLIHACQRNLTPLILLNARLSEKSFARYAKFQGLVKSGLSELSCIAAQTSADAHRLSNLGGNNVYVMGNLKYDIEPPADLLKWGVTLRTLLGTHRKIFLAASTREGEENLLLDALNNIQVEGLLVVIVPRHPQRFNEVREMLAKHHLRYQCRSENKPIAADTQIVLGDSMGEMFAYYAACDMAFIGGSLLPFGGQNLIEACAVGKPVLIGLHTYNFKQASELAVAGRAAVRVQNAADLVETVKSLFAEPDKMLEMGHAGLSFVKSNQGATKCALFHISQALRVAPTNHTIDTATD
jgi:3-deoxy-D-manno-octulosonic-acid transferase